MLRMWCNFSLKINLAETTLEFFEPPAFFQTCQEHKLPFIFFPFLWMSLINGRIYHFCNGNFQIAVITSLSPYYFLISLFSITFLQKYNLETQLSSTSRNLILFERRFLASLPRQWECHPRWGSQSLSGVRDGLGIDFIESAQSLPASRESETTRQTKTKKWKPTMVVKMYFF